MDTDELLKLAANVRVMDELTADGIDVALPLDACGMDIIAVVNSRNSAGGMGFVPIQTVVLREGEIFRNLATVCASHVLTAFVWKRGKEAQMRSFALTSAELILVRMIDLIDGHANAKTDAPPARVSALKIAIEPFAMAPGKWRKKLGAIIAEKTEAKPGETVGQRFSG